MKRKKGGLIGPDGRPLKPPPAPEVVTGMVASTSSLFRMVFGRDERPTLSDDEKEALAKRVDADVETLTQSFRGEGHEELPDTRDLSAYADAYQAALKTCPHTKYEGTSYSRGERRCMDCGVYFYRRGTYE